MFRQPDMDTREKLKLGVLNEALMKLKDFLLGRLVSSTMLISLN